MIELSSEAVTMVAVGSAVVSVVLLGVVLVLALRVRRLREEHRRVFASTGADVVGVLAEHGGHLVKLASHVEQLHTDAEQLRQLQRGTLSKLGVVRYDAFDDMGGMLSFSAALLDERGDGIVISAINGRTETRCYAKPISEARSEQNLSNEEVAAIDAAIAGQPPSVYPPEGRRRRRAAS